MWRIPLLNRLTKEEMINYLELDLKQNEKKSVVVDVAYEKIKDNDILSSKLYNKYKERISLHPGKLEELLSISKTERLKWQDKFKITHYEKFNSYGKSLEYPMFDYIFSHNITQETISKYRKEEEIKTKENRVKGVKKVKETKKINEVKRKNFYQDELLSLIKDWKEVNLELAYTYQLSFWTMWLNRLAKTFQEKSVRSKYKTAEYLKKKEECYLLKNEAIKLLLTSKYAKVKFYRPKHPDKINIHFCEHHLDMWFFEREFGYVGKMEYFETHKKEILKCKNCDIDFKEDYYSLYLLNISCDELDFNFSFHTPFLAGEGIFDNISNYELLDEGSHFENEEGLFRFGRSITNEEGVIFTEVKIKKYFEEAKVSFIDFKNRKETLRIIKE